MTSTGELRCKGRRHRLVLFPKYSPHRHFYPLKHWNTETWVCPSPCKCPVFVCARVKCRRRDVKLSWTRRFCGTDAIQRLHEEKHWKPELQGHYYMILFLQTLLQQKSRASGHPDVQMLLLQEVFWSPQGAFGWSQHKPTLFTFTYPFITFRFFFRFFFPL